MDATMPQHFLAKRPHNENVFNNLILQMNDYALYIILKQIRSSSIFLLKGNVSCVRLYTPVSNFSMNENQFHHYLTLVFYSLHKRDVYS